MTQFSLRCQPGEQSYLLNIDKIQNPKEPQVLASASRIYEEKRTKNNYSFMTKSPLNTTNVMRILLPYKPVNCNITDIMGNKLDSTSFEWDEFSKTCKLVFDNNPNGIQISIFF